MLDIKSSRVLVTGATGFIGFHLTKRLLAEGAEVHLIYREQSNKARLAALKKQADCHQVDLTDFALLRSVVQAVRPQKIFHLAAFTNVNRTMDNCCQAADAIIQGTLNLLRALEGVAYEILINTGTCEEYGDNPVPFTETQIPNPVSPYSAAKVSTTLFCQMLHKTMQLPLVTLRPFLTYGPGQEPNRFIPQAIEAALTGKPFKMTAGEQTREFNYVDDIVAAYLLTAITPAAMGKIINIGNGKEYQMKELVAKIFALAGARHTPDFGALPYRPGETWHFYCDNSLAAEVLGWQAKVSLEEGLQRTIAACQAGE